MRTTFSICTINIQYFFLAIIIAVLSTSLMAQPVIPIPTQPQPPAFTPGAPNIDASSYILMDAASGKVLAEKDADIRLPPASLTKLMSLYIISSAIKNDSIHWNDKVHISTKAWKTEGSRMFVKVGDEIPVKELLRGIIVASGNDATVAMAEYIAGTEEVFASMMNAQAKLLGMVNSHFIDSTGLPNKEHYSTARDLALLTQAYIRHFPEDYSFYSEKWFNFNGIRQPNRNRLLWRFQYADGLKTGHTSEAGYCLVGSAKKDGMRLISVVMGAPNDLTRTEDSIRLLTYGFRFFETHKFYDANKPLIEARTWEGKQTQTPLGMTDDLYITVPTGQYKKLQTRLELNHPLKAPIIKNQSYGLLTIKLNNEVILSKPLVALEDNRKGPIWHRVMDIIKLNIYKYFSKNEDQVNTG